MADYRILEGDVVARLSGLPDKSVQTAITSPPYWGLRDYGTATWQGGDQNCDHSPGASPRELRPAGGLTGGKSTVNAGTIMRGDCSCGARRIDAQLGLEPTPEEYVANMVRVFAEVKRVLRDDGTLWLNLGDSYAGGATTNTGRNDGDAEYRARTRKHGLKPKDLVGIPWRVAFALQADGWYLRSEIIWAKPNPMPESVTDRPTKAHEQVFLLTKSARYFYDADAIREAHRWQDPELLATNAQARQGLRLAQRRAAGDRSAVRTQPEIGRDKGRGRQGNAETEFSASESGRNKRTVWTVATQPFPGAHFAVFPPKLIEPMVLAGSKPGDTILDPFSGAGTTGVVALRHDRDYIGIELNPDYAEMSRQRIYDDGPLLNAEAA